MNCTFDNNTCRAIYTESGSGQKIINCTFSNHDKRAIYIDKKDCVVLGCVFENNSVTDSGGAIYWSGANGNISGCYFVGNNASSNGGAIYINGDTKVIVNYNSFINVTSQKNNGIYVNTVNSNFDFNWWGSNAGPLNSYFSNTNYVPKTWLITNLTGLYNIDNKICNVNVNTTFLVYNKTSGIISSLDNNIIFVRPVVYTIGSSIFNSTTGVSDIYSDLDTFVVYAKVDNQVLCWAGDGSFKSLNDLISITNTGGIVNIPINYTFNNLVDSDFAEGIIVDKSLTINGNGFTIDACDVARIFNIIGNDVILENITLVNGNATCGGAVLWNATGGKVNRSKFYNNTAVNGSAIYAVKDMRIDNSEFLDNMANNTLTFTKTSDTSFNVSFVSGDNKINAIYSNANIMMTNVSYWGSNGETNTLNSNLNDKQAHNLTVKLSDKATEEVYNNTSRVTNSNGMVNVSGLDNDKYYKVDVYHYTGSRFSLLSDEIWGSTVEVSKLELVVPDVVEMGKNLTVVALLNGNATGNVIFTVNGSEYNVSVSEGSARLVFDKFLTPGVYNVTAVYESNGSYYGNRNSSLFTVKAAINPVVNVYCNDTLVISNNLTAVAKSNFNITLANYQLKLFVLGWSLFFCAFFVIFLYVLVLFFFINFVWFIFLFFYKI